MYIAALMLFEASVPLRLVLRILQEPQKAAIHPQTDLEDTLRSSCFAVSTVRSPKQRNENGGETRHRLHRCGIALVRLHRYSQGEACIRA
jgi:hypothetical protein